MNVAEGVQDAELATIAEVERRIDRFFDDSVARAARHSSYYGELWAALRGAATGGKRLRPRLTVATYLHLGGADLAPAIEVATAVELLHTALLLHDDVIDGDLERRGIPNVVGAFTLAAREAGAEAGAAEKWGQAAAILAGDLLIASALRLVASLEVDSSRRARLIDLMDESVFRAAAGELADVAYASGLGTPTAEEIGQMMADKTAHYSLEFPLRAAAILAGSSADLGERLGEIGRSLGIVFQMQDDLLGVFGERAETGKSTSNDLREGKQTMLVAFARGSDAWAQTEDLFGRVDLDDADAQRLREAIEASGARRRFEDEMHQRRDATLELIRAAGLPMSLAEMLEREAMQAVGRRA